jgi:predicted ATPase
MLNGQRLIQKLRIQNLLSFGSEGLDIDLHPLNVLIGPNASGKSNLIEAIDLLHATPGDLTAPVREGGGIDEWLWKGSRPTPIAQLEALVTYSEVGQPLRYQIQITAVGQRLALVDEAAENAYSDALHEDVYFYYRYQNGNPALNVRTNTEAQAGTGVGRTRRFLRREDLRPDQSVLSQRKDPDQYPEITYLGSQFAAIKFYREWDLGRYTAPRLPQKPDLPDDFLLEDASNLGLVLNSLQHRQPSRDLLVEKLRVAYEAVEYITTRIQGGTVQVFVHEHGLRSPIPATRLSDGTLRYLCLLAVLIHPEPPPLICLEEPELGLHPDLIPIIAELLLDAAARSQLIVTTHSPALVSALSHVPETVIVCERDDRGSQFRRLDPVQLREWLDRYALGELWQMGEIGGTRW